MLSLLLLLLMGDLRGIPASPTILISDENEKGENLFAYAHDIQITKTGWLYLLDCKDGKVLKFDMGGKLIKRIGHSGHGPNEIAKGAALASVADEIWIADQEAAQIHIINEDKISRSFKLNKITMPMSLAVLGDEVFVAGPSIHQEVSAIEVYNKSGTLLRSIGGKNIPNRSYKQTSALWNSATIFEGLQGRLAIGFIYDSRVVTINPSGETVIDKDMSAFYDKYEDRKPTGVFPAGYSANGFTTGPGDTWIILGCSFEKKQCSTLLQITKDFRGLEGKRESAENIKQIRFFPDLRLFAVITTNNLIMIYDTKS